MPNNGAITLDDCRRHGIRMLEIDCAKCDRHRLYRLDKLLAAFGPNCSLPALAKFASWDCSRRSIPSIPDQCGARSQERAPAMSSRTGCATCAGFLVGQVEAITQPGRTRRGFSPLCAAPVSISR